MHHNDIHTILNFDDTFFIMMKINVILHIARISFNLTDCALLIGKQNTNLFLMFILFNEFPTFLCLLNCKILDVKVIFGWQDFHISVKLFN